VILDLDQLLSVKLSISLKFTNSKISAKVVNPHPQVDIAIHKLMEEDGWQYREEW